MFHIEVASFGKPTRGNVLASAQVQITSEDGQDTLTLCDARVLRNKSGELWVAHHSQSVADGSGRVSYLPTLDFSKPLRQRISEAVLAAYEQYSGDRKVMRIGERRDFPEVRPAPDDNGQPIRPGGPRGTMQSLLRGNDGR